MYSKHLDMNLGRNSRGRTCTTPANPQPLTPASGEQLRLLQLPGTRTPRWHTSAPLAPTAPPLPPPTAGDPQGGSSRRWWEKNEKGKERREGRRMRARVGEKMGKLHFPPSQSTNLKQAPNSPSTKPLLPLGHPKHTEEPEIKPPETHKHQHTTNNRE